MNRPPAFEGPPIRLSPGAVWGTVQTPSSSRHSGTTAQTMSVAPRMTSTSPTWSAPATICSPRASMVPEARIASGSDDTGPDRVGARHDARQLRGVVEPGVLGHGLVPADEVEQRQRGHRGRGVERADARQRVVGDRLRRPVAGRVGVGLDERGEEPHQLAGLARVGLAVAARAAVVAVEQAVGDRDPVLADGAQRRHHRRDVHRRDCGRGRRVARRPRPGRRGARATTPRPRRGPAPPDAMP